MFFPLWITKTTRSLKRQIFFLYPCFIICLKPCQYMFRWNLIRKRQSKDKKRTFNVADKSEVVMISKVVCSLGGIGLSCWNEMLHAIVQKPKTWHHCDELTRVIFPAVRALAPYHSLWWRANTPSTSKSFCVGNVTLINSFDIKLAYFTSPPAQLQQFLYSFVFPHLSLLFHEEINGWTRQTSTLNIYYEL